MANKLIALAIPVFFLLIGLELWVAKRKGLHVYRLSDALADLGCGVSQQVLVFFWAALLHAGYVFVYEHYRLFTLEGAAAWAVAFVGVDFLYYWWHRLSHRVSFLWAVHVVHHQSEDYNLAVALRQAVFSGVTSWPFNVLLAFAGVPPPVMVATSSLSTLYQFWIHTELVGKLGPIEAALNTPSHHRVHHAVNPRYLDKNYGATLIVWDRLFGTFVPEEEAPVYGVSEPLRSFNSLWAQVQHWVTLGRRSLRAPSLREALGVWVKPPAWHPEWMEEGRSRLLSHDKYDVPLQCGLSWYLASHFAAVVVATFCFLMWGAQQPREVTTMGAGLILLSLAAVGGLTEKKAWAKSLELGRLALVALAAMTFFWADAVRPAAVVGALLFLGGNLLWLHQVTKVSGDVPPARA
ncbi:MAG: sterol desaturase family protein [Myxococcota bacterium]